MDKKEIFNRIEYVVACVGAFLIAMLPSIPSLLTTLFQTFKSFANGKEGKYDKTLSRLKCIH